MFKRISDGVRYIILGLFFPLSLIFIFLVFPIIYGIYLSFLKLDIHNPQLMWQFIGIGNYLKVFSSYYFEYSMIQTFLFCLAVIPIIILGSLSISLLLFQKNFRLAPSLQAIILIPWAIPYVVNASMWRWIFDANYGFVNSVLYQLGIIKNYQAWLGDTWSAFGICILAYIWTELPFCVLLFFARLQSLPIDIYEQSLVDGAGVWLRFKEVYLVWLKPILFVVSVWTTLRAISAFDLIYVITGGGPADFTAFISFFIYRETFVFLDFGAGAALSAFIAVLGFVLVILYYKSIKFVRLR